MALAHYSFFKSKVRLEFVMQPCHSFLVQHASAKSRPAVYDDFKILGQKLMANLHHHTLHKCFGVEAVRASTSRREGYRAKRAQSFRAFAHQGNSCQAIELGALKPKVHAYLVRWITETVTRFRLLKTSSSMFLVGWLSFTLTLLLI